MMLDTLPFAVAAADPAEIPGLSELLRYGLLGIFLVLTIYASMKGLIQWGPSVAATIAAKDFHIKDLTEQRDDYRAMDKEKNAILSRLTTALEETNRARRGGAR